MESHFAFMIFYFSTASVLLATVVVLGWWSAGVFTHTRELLPFYLESSAALVLSAANNKGVTLQSLMETTCFIYSASVVRYYLLNHRSKASVLAVFLLCSLFFLANHVCLHLCSL